MAFIIICQSNIKYYYNLDTSSYRALVVSLLFIETHLLVVERSTTSGILKSFS